MASEESYKGPAYIGIDNGPTGSVYYDGVFKPARFYTKETLNYQKVAKRIVRIDVDKAKRILDGFTSEGDSHIAVMERPLVNPGRFDQSLSSVRAHEAWLIALEDYDIRIAVVDSKAWQKYWFDGIKGSKQLKAASMEMGIDLLPEYRQAISKHNDADSYFIKEWAQEVRL